MFKWEGSYPIGGGGPPPKCIQLCLSIPESMTFRTVSRPELHHELLSLGVPSDSSEDIYISLI